MKDQQTRPIGETLALWNDARKRNLGDAFYGMIARMRQGEPGSLNQLTADVLEAVARGELWPAVTVQGPPAEQQWCSVEGCTFTKPVCEPCRKMRQDLINKGMPPSGRFA